MGTYTSLDDAKLRAGVETKRPASVTPSTVSVVASASIGMNRLEVILEV